MLKRNITYKDFDGNELTEEFYFNLSMSELIKMEVTAGEEGLQAALLKIVAAKDGQSIMDEFERIILASYGVKSPDGKQFIKSPEVRDAFRWSGAYDALFVELCTSEESAAKFVNAVVPAEALKALADQDKPVGPPAVPKPPLPPTT